MSLPETIEPAFDSFSDQSLHHDPDFISMKPGSAILHLLGNALQEIPRNETVLYLNSFAKKHFEIQASVNSAIAFRNDSDFAIIHFSIYSIRAQKEVFHLNLLQPKKKHPA